jgi:hypothetical protein
MSRMPKYSVVVLEGNVEIVDLTGRDNYQKKYVSVKDLCGRLDIEHTGRVRVRVSGDNLKVAPSARGKEETISIDEALKPYRGRRGGASLADGLSSGLRSVGDGAGNFVSKALWFLG